MAEFFRFLMETHMATAAFVIGAIIVAISLLGHLGELARPSPLMRPIFGLFGLLLLGLGVGSYFLSSSPSLEATDTPAPRVPDILPASDTLKSKTSSSGCACVSAGCTGILVKAGADVPASSILEPVLGKRGSLYVYLIPGKAEVDGMLWRYVGDDGQPANRGCVEAQFQFFKFEVLRIIE